MSLQHIASKTGYSADEEDVDEFIVAFVETKDKNIPRSQSQSNLNEEHVNNVKPMPTISELAESVASLYVEQVPKKDKKKDKDKRTRKPSGKKDSKDPKEKKGMWNTLTSMFSLRG